MARKRESSFAKIRTSLTHTIEIIGQVETLLLRVARLILLLLAVILILLKKAEALFRWLASLYF